jgi:hypothetical protein
MTSPICAEEAILKILPEFRRRGYARHCSDSSPIGPLHRRRNPPPRGARGIDDRIEGEDMRGWAEGIRDRLDVDGAVRAAGCSGAGDGNVSGRSPGGFAIGCSGRTASPGRSTRSGGTTT